LFEVPAKELIKANCYQRYSCSKLLLIDVVFIWFSDEMLFTLTNLKKCGEWYLVEQRIKHWCKSTFLVKE